MAHSRIDWTDLQYVLEVANAGSLAAAARHLGVTHSTILRRIAAFEDAQGVRLFDRLPGGYALTAGGEELLGTVKDLAEAVVALERRLAGRDLRLEGMLRVTTTDTLMVSLLAPTLAAFRHAHPGVVLDVSVGASAADLARREADVAIRASSAPAETLVGRRIGPIAFAVYGAVGHSVMTADSRWIAPGDPIADSAAGRWLKSRCAPASIAMRADTMVGMAVAAAAGIGFAPLPCYLGDGWKGLERAAPIDDMPLNELWVLTHADLRRTARVRAFTDFAVAALSAQRAAISGSSARSNDAGWETVQRRAIGYRRVGPKDKKP